MGHSIYKFSEDYEDAITLNKQMCSRIPQNWQTLHKFLKNWIRVRVHGRGHFTGNVTQIKYSRTTHPTQGPLKR